LREEKKPKDVQSMLMGQTRSFQKAVLKMLWFRERERETCRANTYNSGV